MATSVTEGCHSRLSIPPHDDLILPRIGYDAKIIAQKENHGKMPYLVSSLIFLSRASECLRTLGQCPQEILYFYKLTGNSLSVTYIFLPSW